MVHGVPDKVENTVVRAPVNDHLHDVYLVWIDADRYFRYRLLEPEEECVIQKDVLLPRVVPVRRFIPRVCRVPLLYSHVLPWIPL